MSTAVEKEASFIFYLAGWTILAYFQIFWSFVNIESQEIILLNVCANRVSRFLILSLSDFRIQTAFPTPAVLTRST